MIQIKFSPQTSTIAMDCNEALRTSIVLNHMANSIVLATFSLSRTISPILFDSVLKVSFLINKILEIKNPYFLLKSQSRVLVLLCLQGSFILCCDWFRNFNYYIFLKKSRQLTIYTSLQKVLIRISSYITVR